MTCATFVPHNDPTTLPVTNFSTILSVHPHPGGGSVVEWRAAAFRGYPNDNPPPNLDDATAVAAMHRYLRSGLDAPGRRFPGGS